MLLFDGPLSLALLLIEILIMCLNLAQMNGYMYKIFQPDRETLHNQTRLYLYLKLHVHLLTRLKV